MAGKKLKKTGIELTFPLLQQVKGIFAFCTFICVSLVCSLFSLLYYWFTYEYKSCSEFFLPLSLARKFNWVTFVFFSHIVRFGKLKEYNTWWIFSRNSTSFGDLRHGKVWRSIMCCAFSWQSTALNTERNEVNPELVQQVFGLFKSYLDSSTRRQGLEGTVELEFNI